MSGGNGDDSSSVCGFAWRFDPLLVCLRRYRGPRLPGAAVPEVSSWGWGTSTNSSRSTPTRTRRASARLRQPAAFGMRGRQPCHHRWGLQLGRVAAVAAPAVSAGASPVRNGQLVLAVTAVAANPTALTAAAGLHVRTHAVGLLLLLLRPTVSLLLLLLPCSKGSSSSSSACNCSTRSFHNARAVARNLRWVFCALARRDSAAYPTYMRLLLHLWLSPVGPLCCFPKRHRFNVTRRPRAAGCCCWAHRMATV